MKKIILMFICCQPLALKSVLDFTQDRPYSTDIPPAPAQIYFKPDNPTRKCENCPPRKNRWARCNARNLKIKKNDICKRSF